MIDKRLQDLLDKRFESLEWQIDDATNEILEELNCSEISSNDSLKILRRTKWMVLLMGISFLLLLATIIITLLTN